MIGVISDIHGNYPALTAVLTALDDKSCDTIISLGDVAGYYCMINECIEELRKRKIPNILGNHDYYMISGEKCGRSYSANICLDYQRERITSENLHWLENSSKEWKKDRLWAVHGGWNNPIDEYVTDFSFLDAQTIDTDIFISGHTHVQKEVEGKYAKYLNPGSVGQPRDRNPQAAYAIIDDDKNVILCHANYSVDTIVEAMHHAGFQDRISSCLYTGVKIGDNEK